MRCRAFLRVPAALSIVSSLCLSAAGLSCRSGSQTVGEGAAEGGSSGGSGSSKSASGGGDETRGAAAPVTAASSGGAASAGGSAAPTGVLATTKRMALGLPAEAQAYLSWFQVQSGSSDEGDCRYRTYVYLAELSAEHIPGRALEPPLPRGTLLLREAKAPAEDFVSGVYVLGLGEDGWRFQSFGRASSADAFSEGQGPCAPEAVKAALTAIAEGKLVLE
jgi:hypothetical protein